MKRHIANATEKQTRYSILVSLKLLFLLSCNYINVGGQTSPGTIPGKTAKLQIDNAISSIASLSTLSSATPSGSGSCSGPPQTTTITDTESIANDTFQLGYQNRKVNVESNPGAVFQIQGTIDSNNDYDFFYVYSNSNQLIDISLTSGTANCILFVNGIENSNNSTTPTDGNTFSSTSLNSFAITGIRASPTYSLGNNDEEIYLGCSGSSGNSYTLKLLNSTHVSSSPGSASSPNANFIPSYIAPQVFEKEIGGIDSSKIYTHQSVDECVSKIRTDGALIVIMNTQNYIQSVQCGFDYHPFDPIIALSKFCKLEEAHTLQFGDSGIF